MVTVIAGSSVSRLAILSVLALPTLPAASVAQKQTHLLLSASSLNAISPPEVYGTAPPVFGSSGQDGEPAGWTGVTVRRAMVMALVTPVGGSGVSL